MFAWIMQPRPGFMADQIIAPFNYVVLLRRWRWLRERQMTRAQVADMVVIFVNLILIAAGITSIFL
jgi:hypothetical protein